MQYDLFAAHKKNALIICNEQACSMISHYIQRVKETCLFKRACSDVVVVLASVNSGIW